MSTSSFKHVGTSGPSRLPNQARTCWSSSGPQHILQGNNVEQEALRIIKLLSASATEHDFVFAVAVVSV
jgi:hypothetical protein